MVGDGLLSSNEDKIADWQRPGGSTKRDLKWMSR